MNGYLEINESDFATLDDQWAAEKGNCVNYTFTIPSSNSGKVWVKIEDALNGISEVKTKEEAIALGMIIQGE